MLIVRFPKRPPTTRWPKFVANLWTEFAAHRGGALATNRKELQNPNKLVAATFETAKT